MPRCRQQDRAGRVSRHALAGRHDPQAAIGVRRRLQPGHIGYRRIRGADLVQHNVLRRRRRKRAAPHEVQRRQLLGQRRQRHAEPIQWVAARMRLGAIGVAIAVRIRNARVGAQLELLQRSQAIAVLVALSIAGVILV